MTTVQKETFTVATYHLVYHWSTEACKHFRVLCQDSKIAINVILPIACMLEKGKRAKLEVLQCICWKTEHVFQWPAPACWERSCPSWQKRTQIRGSLLLCQGGRTSSFLVQSLCLPWKSFPSSFCEISVLQQDICRQHIIQQSCSLLKLLLLRLSPSSRTCYDNGCLKKIRSC